MSDKCNYIQPLSDGILRSLAIYTFERFADDLIQEARIALYLRRDYLRTRKGAYLVAQHAMVNWMRQQVKRPHISLETDGIECKRSIEGKRVEQSYSFDNISDVAYKQFIRGLDQRQYDLLFLMTTGHTMADVARLWKVDHEVVRRLRLKLANSAISELDIRVTGKIGFYMGPRIRKAKSRV